MLKNYVLRISLFNTEFSHQETLNNKSQYKNHIDRDRKLMRKTCLQKSCNEYKESKFIKLGININFESQYRISSNYLGVRMKEIYHGKLVQHNKDEHLMNES